MVFGAMGADGLETPSMVALLREKAYPTGTCRTPKGTFAHTYSFSVDLSPMNVLVSQILRIHFKERRGLLMAWMLGLER